MGRPKRGALRPLALLLLLLRLQHPAAAADPLLGGQGACGWLVPGPALRGRSCQQSAAWPPAEELRQGPPGRAWQRCRTENGAGIGFSGPSYPLICPLSPRLPLLWAVPSGTCSWGMGSVGARRVGNFAEGEGGDWS